MLRPRLTITAIFLGLVIILIFASAPARADNGLLLSTAFPGIEVQPGETVIFPLELRNSGAPRKVDLLVVSAPEGWQTVFKGSGMIVNQAFAGNESPTNLDFQVEV
ncbi:MAG: hypothetical protein H5T99_02775, partial [Moorella sp. (in: Bacteria)]|nr:hypothetical protein [Moorella sp. (in: firmicutes)]